MSKIICEVCGTSYPETAAQCPICGCVRPGDAKNVVRDSRNRQENGDYNYVKGGRFSKSNVRKRNRAAGRHDSPSVAVSKSSKSEDNKKENKILIVAAIVLLLVIVIVVVYIFSRFFSMNDGHVDPTVTTSPTQTTESTVLTVPCENIQLNVPTITFEAMNDSQKITATAEPSNTTDDIFYRSSDDKVATVDANGNVTAIGPGRAVITVTCGEKTAECVVECAFELPTEGPEEPTAPPIELRFDRTFMVFYKEGNSATITCKGLNASDVKWTSDNDLVATVKNGKVEAVGGGSTTIYGEYEGQKVSCTVHCVFYGGLGTGSGGNVTEDGADEAKGPFRLINTVGGRADDVTITVGYSFTMMLVDANGVRVQAENWTVSDSAVCSVNGGVVTGVGAGFATVSVSYKGETLSFYVHVN